MGARWGTQEYDRWRLALEKQRENKRVVSTGESCPDCGNDPIDDTLHKLNCTRIRNFGADDEYLQYGPPWYGTEDK